MISVAQALSAAVQLHLAGRLAESLEIYDRILTAIPDHADALRLSGLALRRLGRIAAGRRRMEAALAAQPAAAEAWVNLAGVLGETESKESAFATYERAIHARPDCAEAHEGLARALLAQGRVPQAVAAWRRGMAACPARADLGNALGNALQSLQQLHAAEAAYRAALAMDPAYAAAWANRGAALRGLKGRPGDPPPPATAAPLRQALAQALVSQRIALRVDPFFPAAHDGLGQTLLLLDRPGESPAHHRRAIALQPDFTGAYANLGNALLALNDAAAAAAAYRRAVAIAPALPDPRRNLGIALLLQGDFPEGWREYEWRLACADSQTPPIPRPRWNGEPLNGRTILLHAEQGLGDALHFARYVPLAAALGGRVALCAPPALERLFARLPGMDRFIPGGAPFSLAGVDLHAPLMSLPYILGTTLTNLPAPVAYLRPDLAETLAWRRRLEKLEAALGESSSRTPVLRVGVVWAGSPTHGNDRNRSLPLDALAGLAAIPGLRLTSLQKGPAADALAARAQAGDSPFRGIVNPAADIHDFADTAAIAANLDLIVCVDTSVAHLAAALGRPTWVLLPFAPDWRWMLRRDDNPWYPTLRLFRQNTPGDWGPVLDEVATRLRNLIGS